MFKLTSHEHKVIMDIIKGKKVTLNQNEIALMLHKYREDIRKAEEAQEKIFRDRRNLETKLLSIANRTHQ